MSTALTQHWRTLFENKYLGAWNLWDAAKGAYRSATNVTIDRMTYETVTMQGGRKEEALIAYFKGKQTPMIITKKMGRIIASAYGPIPAGWVGKPITLYVEVGFKTKDGPADVLRIKNMKAGSDMKDQLRKQAPPEEFFDEGDPNAPPGT